MEIKKYEEITTSVVFETDTHKYKVKDEKLEDLKTKGNLPLFRHIQKSMRQTADDVTGKQWQDSAQGIFQEITGQLSVLQKHLKSKDEGKK